MLALIVGGCGHRLPASVAGGECRVFVAPIDEVRGKAKSDQNWIDDTVESGVAGCGWERPKKKKVVKKAQSKKKVVKPKVVEKVTPQVEPTPVVEPVPPFNPESAPKEPWWKRVWNKMKKWW